MARKLLIRDSFNPYHVTNRTRSKRFYSDYLNIEDVWKIFVQHLCVCAWAYGAKIHAFVLMSNHYHLLLSTPHSNIDEIICYLQSQVSFEIFKKTQTRELNFNTRYRWTLIKNLTYYMNVYRYVYQNPLRANLTTELQHYPYSTFHGQAGYSKLEIPFCQHCYHPLEHTDEEAWLNKVMPQEQLTLVRKGIRRFEFKIPNRDLNKLSQYR